MKLSVVLVLALGMSWRLCGQNTEAYDVTIQNTGTNALIVGGAITFGTSLGDGGTIQPGGNYFAIYGFQGDGSPYVQSMYVTYRKIGSSSNRFQYLGAVTKPPPATPDVPITLPLQDNSPCTYTLDVQNGGSIEGTWEVLIGGNPNGQFVTVGPGQTERVVVIDPNCNPGGVQVVKVIGGLVTGGTPTSGDAAGGTQTAPPQGGNITVGGPVTGLGTNTGFGGANELFVPPFVAPTNQPITGLTNFNGTNVAQNGAIITGFNAEATIDQQGFQAVVDAIKAADAAARAKTNFGPAGGGTNIVSISNNIIVTNAGAATDYSNVLAVIASNTLPLGAMSSNISLIASNTSASNQLALATSIQSGESNELASATAAMLAATNGAGALGDDSLSAAAGGKFAGNLGVSGGSAPLGWTLTSPNLTLAIVAAPPATVAPVGVVHDLIEWAVYVTLFLANYKVFSSNLKTALLSPQATTAGEQILGTNVNFASALVVAGLIVAACAVIPAIALPQLVSLLGSVAGNPFAAISAIPGWSYAMTCCPFDVIASCIVSHVVFRISLDGLTFVTQGIIRFFVGL